MYLVTPKDPECQSWTYDRPSAPVLHRITVLAKRSADALEGLLSPAAAAAAADAEAAAAASPAAASSAKKQKQQQAAAKGGSSEAAAADAALARLFGRDEREYDVLLRLRQEALPNMDRGCLLPGQAPVAKAAAAAEGSGQGGALAAALEAEQPAVSKHCRAILKGIPQSEYAGQGRAGRGGVGEGAGKAACICVLSCAGGRGLAEAAGEGVSSSLGRRARAPSGLGLVGHQEPIAATRQILSLLPPPLPLHLQAWYMPTALPRCAGSCWWALSRCRC